MGKDSHCQSARGRGKASAITPFGTKSFPKQTCCASQRVLAPPFWSILTEQEHMDMASFKCPCP